VAVNLGTLLGQSITFFVFLWCCYKFIWPALTDAMRERQETIAEGLANAERASRDLEQAQARAEEALAEAKSEAQQIIDQARAQANQMVEDAKSDASAERERILEAAQADVEQEMNRARESLRGQVADLAVVGASKIIGDTIDRDQHSEILAKLATEL